MVLNKKIFKKLFFFAEIHYLLSTMFLEGKPTLTHKRTYKT